MCYFQLKENSRKALSLTHSLTSLRRHRPLIDYYITRAALWETLLVAPICTSTGSQEASGRPERPMQREMASTAMRICCALASL
mmetsp:Transcript_15597/g.21387  ORF Transcript_15597/g.21387 Transcript_15597/m.21387 type:complete len:84 (-) Transcript_15597:760-1011(-)